MTQQVGSYQSVHFTLWHCRGSYLVWLLPLQRTVPRTSRPEGSHWCWHCVTPSGGLNGTVHPVLVVTCSLIIVLGVSNFALLVKRRTWNVELNSLTVECADPNLNGQRW